MPFKSEAQRRLLHLKAKRGEMSEETVHEWESKTKDKKKLPYHVKKSVALVIKAMGATPAIPKLKVKIPKPPKAPMSAKSPTPTMGAKPARVEKNPLAQKERVGQPSPVVPPKLHLAKGVNMYNANQGGMSPGGNKYTQIPSMRLYLDLDPFDDHHGHGFWTGKYDPDRKQDQYVVTEQDQGRPMLNVEHYYEEVPPEIEDQTIKAMLPAVQQARRESRSGRADVSPKALNKLEPKSLRRLHGKPPRRAKLKFTSGGHHGHPAIVIRTKRRMPRLGHGMRIKIRRTVRRKK